MRLYATLRLASLSASQSHVCQGMPRRQQSVLAGSMSKTTNRRSSWPVSTSHIRFFFDKLEDVYGVLRPPVMDTPSVYSLSLSRSFGWLQATSAVYADVRHSDTTGHDQPTNDCRTLAPRVCTAKRLEHGGAQNAYRPDEGSRRRRDGLARRP